MNDHRISRRSFLAAAGMAGATAALTACGGQDPAASASGRDGSFVSCALRYRLRF